MSAYRFCWRIRCTRALVLSTTLETDQSCRGTNAQISSVVDSWRRGRRRT
jgi:hypothetical protein